jgi:hypothetical protein
MYVLIDSDRLRQLITAELVVQHEMQRKREWNSVPPNEPVRSALLRNKPGTSLVECELGEWKPDCEGDLRFVDSSGYFTSFEEGDTWLDLTNYGEVIDDDDIEVIYQDVVRSAAKSFCGVTDD